jgi:leucyl-tRNA synthetase
MTDQEPSDDLKKVLHKTIKKVTLDTNGLEFNTAISQMMIFINEVYKEEKCYRKLWNPLFFSLPPMLPTWVRRCGDAGQNGDPGL